MAVNGGGISSGGSRSPAGDGRLRSWKEIASYFGADERTVKRWEVSRGLPVHRVPGEARAPVYAYEAELAAWLKSGQADESVAAEIAPIAAPRRSLLPALAIAVVIAVVLGLAALQGWRHAEIGRQEAAARTADVRQLARSQVAALNDRLERQPGNVKLRATLAHDAAVMLAKVAALPDATPELRRDAAEAYRRLSIVQNAVDRPSLRDRPAARASLAAALRLVADDPSPPGRLLRAHILTDAARQAAADGAVGLAPAMLKAAAADAPPALHDELALAEAEVADWQGDYARAVALAGRVSAAPPADVEAALRQLRGLDLAAEARFYGGNKPASLAGYRAALAAAGAGLARWPQDSRWRWALQRQQWNLGTTLTDMGRGPEALAMLLASRDGWLAMAHADPEDESVAAWVRISRLAYGEALAGAGRNEAAIAELSASLADRRNWLAERPDNAERRRQLVVGLNALGDVFAGAGRRAEACAAYGESSAMVDRMDKAGTLTGLDRDSMVKLLNESLARHCSAGGGSGAGA